MTGISFLVPTLGRPSLQATLDSIECWPGDEILVIGDHLQVNDPRVRVIQCAPGGDWGHTERNVAMPVAKGRYLAHIDDDDVYAPGTRAVMADAIAQTPDRPVLFRMQYPNGGTLWRWPTLAFGNVGTPMILIPNVLEKLGRFESFHGGDYAYLASMKWSADDIVWRPEVTALLGHNP